MRREQETVQISTADVTPALGLLDEKSGVLDSTLLNTLDFTAKEPGRFAKTFRSGNLGGIRVTVNDPPEPGGAHLWSCAVQFPRKLDLPSAFARVGLDWVPWWAIGVGEVTTLVDKINHLQISGFCWPQVALPWFLKLHAAYADLDPAAPVTVVRTYKQALAPGHADIDDLGDLIHEVQALEYDEHYLALQYAEWKPREAEWRRQAFPNG